METITKFIQYESHYLDLLQLTLSIIMDNKNILLKVDKSKIYLKFFQPHRLRLPSVSPLGRALFRGLVLLRDHEGKGGLALSAIPSGHLRVASLFSSSEDEEGSFWSEILKVRASEAFTFGVQQRLP
jgi:hypothetical protein